MLRDLFIVIVLFSFAVNATIIFAAVRAGFFSGPTPYEEPPQR